MKEMRKANSKHVIFMVIWLISSITMAISHHSTSSSHDIPIPKAIIHIGPYKTGTTSFQTFLLHNSHFLTQENYYFLGNCTKSHRIISERVKGYHEMDAINQKVGYRDCSVTYKELDQFLSHHSHSKRNIIFSTEEFSSLNLHEIIKLQELFIGYEVKIILVYRLWIQLVYSYFNQHAKSFRGKPYFEYYMNDNSITDPILLSSFYSQLITNYKSTFRAQNIYIIDYYGMLYEKKEIIQVIICDILSICSNKDLYYQISQITITSIASTPTKPNSPSRHSSSSHDPFVVNHREILYYFQYLESFNQYLRIYHSCHLKYHYFYYLNSTHLEITSQLWSNLSLASIPLHNKSNPFLIQQSLEQDQLIRSTHNDVHWLYSNPLTNQLIAEKFTYEEVNTMKLLGSTEQTERFQRIKESFDNKGVLICQGKKKKRRNG